MTDDLMSTAQVAEYLNVTPQTLANWAYKGKGPQFIKFDGRRRYDPADVRAWTEARKQGQPAKGPRLNCSKCKKPVTSDGCLGVSHSAVHQVRIKQKAYEEYVAEKAKREGEFASRTISGSEWDLIPDPAQWFILHRGCAADPERNDYWYDIERVNTYPKFLSFLAHVTKKGWVTKYTDLSSLIRRVIGE